MTIRRRWTLRERLPKRLPFILVFTEQERKDMIWLFDHGIQDAADEHENARMLRLRSLRQKFRYAGRYSRRWRAVEPDDVEREGL